MNYYTKESLARYLGVGRPIVVFWEQKGLLKTRSKLINTKQSLYIYGDYTLAYLKLNLEQWHKEGKIRDRNYERLKKVL